MKANCFVCGKRASGALGIRLRKQNTNAIWAPNLNAYLCDLHSISGGKIELRYEETGDGKVTAIVFNNGTVVSRITHDIGGRSQDESLF